MPEPRPLKRLRRQITDTSAEDDDIDLNDDEGNESYDQDTIYVRAQQETVSRSVLFSSTIFAMPCQPNIDRCMYDPCFIHQFDAGINLLSCHIALV